MLTQPIMGALAVLVFCDLGPGTHHLVVTSVDEQGRRSEVSNDYVVLID